MTIITPYRNPLDSLVETLEQEAATRAALAEVEMLEHNAEREAEAALAEATRRANAKRAFLTHEVKSFAHGFFESIAKHASQHKWSPQAVKDAKAYAEFLLRHDVTDVAEPKVNPGIRDVVRSKFTYGLALGAHKMPNVMRDHHFAAQHQGWFQSLFIQKEHDVQRQRGGK